MRSIRTSGVTLRQSIHAITWLVTQDVNMDSDYGYCYPVWLCLLLPCAIGKNTDGASQEAAQTAQMANSGEFPAGLYGGFTFRFAPRLPAGGLTLSNN